jgi:hypothetical protein
MLRMIRPFTCVCFLLACGSGLYLYQAKHRVQVIDRAIANAVHATDELREQSRVLRAEWTLENDPQRLQTLADQFLALKSVAPSQFTGMANLDGQLPTVPVAGRPTAEPPPDGSPSEAAGVPLAQAPGSQPPQPAGSVEAQVSEPPQPAPPSQPQVSEPTQPTGVASSEPASGLAASTQRPSEHKPVPAAAHTANAEQPPVRPPKVLARPVVAIVQPHPVVQPRPVQPMPAPSSGSALGMAHTATAPPPKPLPFGQLPGGPGG